MHRFKSRFHRLTAAALACLAVGCTTTGRQVSGWGEITVAPGDTGSCQSLPCRVLFEMPPGDGNYKITIAHIDAGEYPAGKTVSVGSFHESRAIRVSGTNLPPAYVYVPESTSDIH